jgi:hypothetical protein
VLGQGASKDHDLIYIELERLGIEASPEDLAVITMSYRQITQTLATMGTMPGLDAAEPAVTYQGRVRACPSS